MGNRVQGILGRVTSDEIEIIILEMILVLSTEVEFVHNSNTWSQRNTRSYSASYSATRILLYLTA